MIFVLDLVARLVEEKVGQVGEKGKGVSLCFKKIIFISDLNNWWQWSAASLWLCGVAGPIQQHLQYGGLHPPYLVLCGDDTHVGHHSPGQTPQACAAL